MALDLKQNERIRTLARRLMKDRFSESETELARALDVNPSTVNRFLSGKSGTSMDVAFRVSKLAGVDLNDALAGKVVQVPPIPEEDSVQSPAPPPVSDTYVANDIVDGLVNAAFDPTRHMASDIIPVVEALKETAALMSDYMDHAAYARYLLDAQATARESGKRISPKELPFAALGVSHRLRLKMQALVDQKMKDAEARIVEDGGTVLPPGETHPAIKKAQEMAKKKGQR